MPGNVVPASRISRRLRKNYLNLLPASDIFFQSDRASRNGNYDYIFQESLNIAENVSRTCASTINLSEKTILFGQVRINSYENQKSAPTLYDSQYGLGMAAE